MLYWIVIYARIIQERHTIIIQGHNEKCRALIGIDYAPATIIRYGTALRLTSALFAILIKEDLFLDELPNQLIADYEFLY